MNKKLLLVVLLIAGIAGFSGKIDTDKMFQFTNKPAAQQAINVVDSTNTQVSIKEPADRVVTLTGSDSELLLRLGKDPVGVVISESSPEATKEKLKEFPNVGEAVGPSVELILNEDPDLVIGSGMSFQLKLRKTFDQEGIPSYFHVARSYDEVLKQILDTGELIGKNKEAEDLVNSYQAKMKAIKARHKDEPQQRIVIVFGTPVSYYLATSNTYVGDIFRQVGAKNEADAFLLTGDIQGDGKIKDIVKDYKADRENKKADPSKSAAEVSNGFVALNLETMTQLNPDRVFLVMHGGGENAEENFKNAFKTSVWKNIPAIKNGDVNILPGELFSTIPAARIDQVLDYLEEAMYGKQQ